MRTVLDACPADFDASSFPFPFDTQLYQKSAQLPKLAFGYAMWDGHVRPTAPMVRAMKETVKSLRAAGHEGALRS